MKDFQQTSFGTRSEHDSSRPEKRRILLFIAKSLIMLSGLAIVLLVLLQIPKFLFSPIRNIEIQGNQILSDDEIVKSLEINKTHSWIGLDPFELSVNLKRNPWIEKAHVSRDIPLKLNVNVVERRPIAYLKTKNGTFLIGKEFLALEKKPSIRTWDLPIIVNHDLEQVHAGDLIREFELEKAVELIEILKDCKTLSLDAVSEINVSNPFNLELITIPYGIKIKLGFQDFKRKLAGLTYVAPQIDWQRNDIEYLDLRTVQGVVMKRKSL